MADTELTDMTELKTFTGDEPIYLVDDPAGTPVDRKARVGNFFPPVRPFFGDSTVYLMSHLGVPGGGAVTAGRLFMSIIYVPYERTFTKLTNYVTSNVAGNAKLAIYNVNQETLQPTTHIVTGTEIDTSTGNLKELTINQLLTPGFYALASIFSAAPSVIWGNSPVVQLGAAFAATQRPTFGLVRTLAYASYAGGDETGNTFTAVNAGTYSGCPVIGIR